MCGIIGCIGQCNCFEKLFDGLKQLQNRGYDSAGVCTINGKGEFIINKMASSQENNHDAVHVLHNSCQSLHLEHKIGIGHTRWATHGPKTNVNAHPHTDMNNLVCLVHNGIIENYQEIKDFLIQRKFTFQTETDTEVIANLISFYLDQDEPDCFRSAVSKATQKLSGTYALAILFKHDPCRMYCVRKGSPLLIGVGDTFVIVTSEPAGFNGTVKDYYVLNPNTVCVIEKTKRGVEVDITKMNKLEIDTDYSACLGSFPHWTIKEIHEQSDSVYRALSNGGRLVPHKHWVRLGGLDWHSEKLADISHLILLGCGKIVA